MKVHEFIWPEDRVDHIARHGIRPEEVEEVCFGRALVQRAKSAGKNPSIMSLDKQQPNGICSVSSSNFLMAKASR
jgi:hypothetical protein